MPPVTLAIPAGIANPRLSWRVLFLGSPSSMSAKTTADAGSLKLGDIPRGMLLTVAQGRGCSALPSASSRGLCRCRWGCHGPPLRPRQTSRLCSQTWCRHRIPRGELQGGQGRITPRATKPRQGGLQRKHLLKYLIKRIS